MSRRMLVILDGKPGAYGAVIPIMPGCTAMGRTVSEALANLAGAVEAWQAMTSRSKPPLLDNTEKTMVRSLLSETVKQSKQLKRKHRHGR
jgi:predicted RNase H-like HicB family nuclease